MAHLSSSISNIHLGPGPLHFCSYLHSSAFAEVHIPVCKVQAGPSFPVLPPFPGKLSSPTPHAGGHPRDALISSDGQCRQEALQSAPVLPSPCRSSRAFPSQSLTFAGRFRAPFRYIAFISAPTLASFSFSLLWLTFLCEQSSLLPNLMGTHNCNFPPELPLRPRQSDKCKRQWFIFTVFSTFSGDALLQPHPLSNQNTPRDFARPLVVNAVL